MKLVSDFKLNLDMTLGDVELVLGLIEYYLVHTRKSQYLNKQEPGDFTNGCRQQIDLYKMFATFLNKAEVANQVIQNLTEQIDSYFTEKEKIQYGIYPLATTNVENENSNLELNYEN